MLFGVGLLNVNKVQRNFGTSVLNGLHDLQDISTFVYNGSQIIVVTERECSTTAEDHQTLITTRIHEAPILAQYTRMTKTLRSLGNHPLLTLINHHPASLYKGCDEEMLKYYLRMEMQPGSHRWTAL